MNQITEYFCSMQPHEIIAQVFGVLGIAISLVIYAGKTRKQILLCKFLSDALWFVNYILLGAYTGALLNLIAMGRETVFYNRERKKWASYRAWLYVFMAVTLLSPMIELWKSESFIFMPLLPAIGSCFAVVSFYSKMPRVMRIFGFTAQIFWLIYGIWLGNPSSILSCSLTMTSTLIGTARELYAKRKSRSADSDDSH